MKKFVTIIAFLISLKSFSQDSIAVKVLRKPTTVADTTWYHVRINFIDGSHENVVVKCCCPERPKRSKGELVMVSKKDLILTDSLEAKPIRKRKIEN